MTDIVVIDAAQEGGITVFSFQSPVVPGPGSLLSYTDKDLKLTIWEVSATAPHYRVRMSKAGGILACVFLEARMHANG